MTLKTSHLFILASLLLAPLFANSVDVIKVNRGHSDKDTRHLYNWQVLKHALEITESAYGDYRIQITGEAIPNHQRLRELELGRYLNVAMSVTHPDWEERITPIRVPIRFEAFKYRLLLIHEKDVDRFAHVQTLRELQTFSTGVRQSWTTKDVLLKNHFVTLPAYSYEALFAMLEKGRFEFILRGVHEIYPELEARKKQLPHIVVEPHLVVEIPDSYYYLFVSPKTPRIKQRLTEGLRQIMDNGTLKQLFDKHYGEYFDKANLSSRTTIRLNGLNN